MLFFLKSCFKDSLKFIIFAVYTDTRVQVRSVDLRQRQNVTHGVQETDQRVHAVGRRPAGAFQHLERLVLNQPVEKLIVPVTGIALDAHEGRDTPALCRHRLESLQVRQNILHVQGGATLVISHHLAHILYGPDDEGRRQFVLA